MTNMIFQASDAQIEAFRANVTRGIDARMTIETAAREAIIASGKNCTLDLANTRKCLGSITLNNNAFSVHYLAAHAFDWHDFVVSVKYNGEHCNIYAMKKCACVATVLNGGSFVGDASDNNTVTACVLALQAKHETGSALNNAVNDKMSAWGKGNKAGVYGSAGTQNGSTLRVLEALGIVARNGARAWQVTNAEGFKLLVTAAKKHDKFMSQLAAQGNAA